MRYNPKIMGNILLSNTDLPPVILKSNNFPASTQLPPLSKLPLSHLDYSIAFSLEIFQLPHCTFRTQEPEGPVKIWILPHPCYATHLHMAPDLLRIHMIWSFIASLILSITCFNSSPTGSLAVSQTYLTPSAQDICTCLCFCPYIYMVSSHV